jgi:hypothetical protein
MLWDLVGEVRANFIDAMRSAMPPGAPAVCSELVSMVKRYHEIISGGSLEALTAGLLWSQPPASAALDRAGPRPRACS